MNLFQYAGLHLLGGLIGESHGKDMAIDGRLLNNIADIFVCQLIGLAGTGTRIQDFRSHGSKSRFSK